MSQFIEDVSGQNSKLEDGELIGRDLVEVLVSMKSKTDEIEDEEIMQVTRSLSGTQLSAEIAVMFESSIKSSNGKFISVRMYRKKFGKFISLKMNEKNFVEDGAKFEFTALDSAGDKKMMTLYEVSSASQDKVVPVLPKLNPPVLQDEVKFSFLSNPREQVKKSCLRGEIMADVFDCSQVNNNVNSPLNDQLSTESSPAVYTSLSSSSALLSGGLPEAVSRNRNTSLVVTESRISNDPNPFAPPVNSGNVFSWPSRIPPPPKNSSFATTKIGENPGFRRSLPASSAVFQSHLDNRGIRNRSPERRRSRSPPRRSRNSRSRSPPRRRNSRSRSSSCRRGNRRSRSPARRRRSRSRSRSPPSNQRHRVVRPRSPSPSRQRNVRSARSPSPQRVRRRGSRSPRPLMDFSKLLSDGRGLNADCGRNKFGSSVSDISDSSGSSQYLSK